MVPVESDIQKLSATADGTPGWGDEMRGAMTTLLELNQQAVRRVTAAVTPETVPLTLRGATGQTADLQRWESDAGAAVARVLPGGEVLAALVRNVAGTGPTVTLGASSVRVIAAAAANVPLVSRGAAAQTGALQEWQNDAAAVLASVSAAGLVAASFAGVTGTRTFEVGAVDSAGVGFRTVRVAN